MQEPKQKEAKFETPLPGEEEGMTINCALEISTIHNGKILNLFQDKQKEKRPPNLQGTKAKSRFGSIRFGVQRRGIGRIVIFERGGMRGFIALCMYAISKIRVRVCVSNFLFFLFSFSFYLKIMIWVVM